MSKIKSLYQKHRELILYIFFGGLTTLLNLCVFYLFELILGKELYWVSNIIAWVVAALFAYFVNKLFVFESKSWAPQVVWREGLEFLGARVFSFLIEEAGLFLFVELCGFDQFAFVLFGKIVITGAFIAKVILAVIVIILNYFFSKFIIFKKQPTQEKQKQE